MIAGSIIKAGNHKVGTILVVGGLGCIIGAFCALFVIDPNEWLRERHERLDDFMMEDDENRHSGNNEDGNVLSSANAKTGDESLKENKFIVGSSLVDKL